MCRSRSLRARSSASRSRRWRGSPSAAIAPPPRTSTQPRHPPRPSAKTMDGVLYPLTLITAIGCGLNAGGFFACSSFVRKALARLQPTQGVAAMQAINLTAISFAFMLALFGTALACIAVAGLALAHPDASYAPCLLAGSGLYITGVIVVTIAFH